MTCQFQSPRDEIGFNCSINRYGGKPHALACEQCIKSGLNVEQSRMPDAIEMAKSFANSMGSWAKSGFAVTDEETLEKRMAICKACPEWDEDGMGGTGRCRKCGCSTQAKLRMASEKCPIDKW